MLNNIKIGTRMVIGYGTVMALLLIVGGYLFSAIQSLDEKIGTLVNDRMVKSEQADLIINNVNIIARGLRNIIIDANRENQEKELLRIAESRKIISETIDHMKAASETGTGKEMIGKVENDRNEYVKTTEHYMDLIKAEQMDAAKESLLTDVRTSQNTYMETLDTFIGGQTRLAQESGKEAEALAQRSSILIGVLLLAALGFSFVSGILIIRSITSPIKKTVAMAETMAGGDFTARLPIDQKDEIGIMATAMNSMAGQLGMMMKEIVKDINILSGTSSDMAAVSRQLSASVEHTAGKSNAVAAATEEMSTNFHSVSAAMEESSSNVGMVASATEEMTATVNEIGQNAEKARTISENAVKQSHLASEKMNALGESAHRVGKVTETITEISEQTNLLALNATIEAARAGGGRKGICSGCQ